MTDDIVERLRAPIQVEVSIDGPLKREAANEIERLREALREALSEEPSR